jgi:hypothetical protein
MPSSLANLTIANGAAGGITIDSGSSLTNAAANGTITLKANKLTFASTTTSTVQETGSNGTVAIFVGSVAGIDGVTRAGAVTLTSTREHDVAAGTSGRFGVAISASLTVLKKIHTILDISVYQIEQL